MAGLLKNRKVLLGMLLLAGLIGTGIFKFEWKPTYDVGGGVSMKLVRNIAIPDIGRRFFLDQVKVDPSGTRVALLLESNYSLSVISIIDIASGKELARIDDGVGMNYMANQSNIDWSPDGSLIMIGTAWAKRDTIGIWDSRTGKEKYRVAVGGVTRSPAYFSPDGKKILVNRSDFPKSGRIEVYQIDNNALVYQADMIVPAKAAAWAGQDKVATIGWWNKGLAIGGGDVKYEDCDVVVTLLDVSSHSAPTSFRVAGGYHNMSASSCGLRWISGRSNRDGDRILFQPFFIIDASAAKLIKDLGDTGLDPAPYVEDFLGDHKNIAVISKDSGSTIFLGPGASVFDIQKGKYPGGEHLPGCCSLSVNAPNGILAEFNQGKISIFQIEREKRP